MTSTWRRAVGVLGASLALACGGGGSEPSTPAPSWESTWSAENAGALEPHLARFAAIRAAYEEVQDQAGDQVVQPLPAAVRIKGDALLITDGALLDPTLNSGQHPTVSLEIERNPRLDQLQSLSQGKPVSSFFTVQLADALLRELEQTEVVLVTRVRISKFPQMQDDSTFNTGAFGGTAHLFDYETAAYYGRVDYAALNSDTVNVSRSGTLSALQIDLGRNTQLALAEALGTHFPKVQVPQAPAAL